jgi:L-fuculose-phosphate aldolase
VSASAAPSVAELVADLPAAVVRAARAMHEKGLVVSSLGNVSVRHHDGLIITPTRWPYPMLHVKDLVAVGPDGACRGGTREPSSDWMVHRDVYEARPDVQAIVHTHSVWATAWGWRGEPLTLPTEERRYLDLGEIAVTEPAPAGTPELAESVVRGLGTGGAVLVAQHGVLAVGEDPMGALETCEVVEREAHLETLVRLVHPKIKETSA